MTRYDKLLEWFTTNRGVPYDDSGGDNNSDGIPNRAQLPAIDGGGEDCSGAVWDSYRWASLPDPPPFPLSSTAGYAFMSDHMGWTVALDRTNGLAPDTALEPGDILIYDKYRDPYNSEGQRGHTEIWMSREGDMFHSMGSDGNGVDFYTRPAKFWCMAIRVPGTSTISPDDLAKLIAFLEEYDVEHGMAVDVILNPSDPTSGYTLDRWGGVHQFGHAPAATVTAYWPGQDVARKVLVTNWTTGAGYVMDLDGALHPFNGAPRVNGLPYWKGGKIVGIAEY